jgi:lipopolysaccharide transport protein LptA
MSVAASRSSVTVTLTRLVPGIATALLWLATLPGSVASSAGAGGAVTGDIQIEADGLQLDYGANTLRMPNVVIRQHSPQGDLLIRAREARAHSTQPSFENSQWTFTGQVHVEYQDGVLDADTAQLTFVKNQLQHAAVDGAPANFSHQFKNNPQRNRGSARHIELDVPRQRVRLAGDAWYTDSRNEVKTAAILYNMTDRSFETERGTAEENRVHMTIRPDTAPKP